MRARNRGPRASRSRADGDADLLLRRDGSEVPLRRYGADRFLQLRGPTSEHLLHFVTDRDAS